MNLVAFVGFISNIHSLCTTYHWLAWLCNAPGIVINVIQGFLPALLLTILFMLVPIVLRILARLEGIPQRTGVELSLMDRFFLFQVIVRVTSVVPHKAHLTNMTERLFGCFTFGWYYCCFAWPSP